MSNRRLRPLFVNESERVLDGLLVNTCRTFDARLHAKVRLGDVVDFSQSGISNEDFGYATRAHLDFIILKEIRANRSLASNWTERRIGMQATSTKIG